jgi:hypothetical protein
VHGSARPDDREAAEQASAARKTIFIAAVFAAVSFAFQLVIVGFMAFACGISENLPASAIARCHANESGWYVAALAIPPFAILVGGLVAAARRRRAILNWTFVLTSLAGVLVSLSVLGYWS